MEGDEFIEYNVINVTISIHALRVEGDTPPPLHLEGGAISIHALRVEGDLFIWRIKSINQLFLSTPSGWRATTGRFVLRFVGIKISIHALRVEGDTSHTADNGTSHGISIHALRVEGD